MSVSFCIHQSFESIVGGKEIQTKGKKGEKQMAGFDLLKAFVKCRHKKNIDIDFFTDSVIKIKSDTN